MGRLGALGLCCAVALAAGGKDKKDDVSQIGTRDVSRGVNFYSLEKEIALGHQLAQEVARQSKLVTDPLVSEYVNRLGQNLARHSDAKVPFTFQVVEADTLNAFALPGGFVFVNTGLIKAAETEAELAGAMAHEIAHVAARHWTRQATRRELVNWASLPLILLGGWTGYGVQQAARVGIPMGMLSFERKYEAEADYLGMQYMYQAGYDPSGAVDLFERLLALSRRNPGLLERAFATHPMDGERIRKAQKEIETILPARAEYVVTTSGYEQMRQRLLEGDGAKARRGEGRPTLRTAPGVPSGNPEERPTIQRRDDYQEEGSNR